MTRRLSDAERALWSRVAATVEPMHRRRPPLAVGPDPVPDAAAPAPAAPRPVARPLRQPAAPRSSEVVRNVPPPRPLDHHGLDASWDRRLAKGQVAPDFTLDLHGCTLDQAHARLDHGLTLAASQGARLVLLVTGRARPSDDHGREDFGGRSDRRGAIRAKFLDWLTAGPHASRIATVRPAHPRHGGGGAVYVVMRRAR